MTPALRNRPALLLATVLLAPAVLIGCAATASTPEPPTPEPPTATSANAGDGVDGGGAAEVAEPARALVVADERGELTLLDLSTGERTIIAEAGGELDALDGTGRFVLLTREQDGRSAVDVVDSGRWTQPHGDHSHYFAGTPRDLGTIEGAGRAAVGVGADATVIRFDGDDVAVTLTHEQLAAEGTDAAARAAVDATGPVVAVADSLVAATADGIVAPGLAAAPCASPSDVDATRVGTVFACAEGAVLVRREVGGAVGVESIPYPAGVPAASALSGCPDRPDLAGVAGTQGAWLLDVRARTWTLLASDVPFVRAAAVGDDDSRMVALDTDGRVRILAADGVVLARTEPLVAGAVADDARRDDVQLVVDGDHAYLSDPATGSVHEIALDDGAVTRAFADLRPRAIALVG